MNPHVIFKSFFLLHLASAQVAFKLPLRLMNLHMLFQQFSVPEGFKADSTSVLVRKVHQILVLIHLPSVNKHKVTLCALDIQRLPLMGIGNMLLKVPLVTKCLSA